MPKETGIIMSGDHPRLIIDKIKTMTRRTYGLEEVNKDPDAWEFKRMNDGGIALFWRKNIMEEDIALCKCPYGQVGDLLIIKETWASEKQYDHLKPREIPDTAKIYYVNKLTYSEGDYSLFTKMGKVRSAMFMCNWMSRAKPEITEVRAERLQEITTEDAIAEGCEMMSGLTATGAFVGLVSQRFVFMKLWDSLNAKRGYAWVFNPWAWPISFKEVDHGQG